jgi:hypothetical protein
MTTFDFIDIKQILLDGNNITILDNDYGVPKKLVSLINSTNCHYYGCKLSIFDDNVNINGCRNYKINSDTDCDTIVDKVFKLSNPIVMRDLTQNTKSITDPYNASYRECFNINESTDVVTIYPKVYRQYMVFDNCFSGNEQTMTYLADGRSYGVQVIATGMFAAQFPDFLGNQFDYVLTTYVEPHKQRILYDLYFKSIGSFDFFVAQLNNVKELNSYLVTCFHGVNRNKVFYCKRF